MRVRMAAPFWAGATALSAALALSWGARAEPADAGAADASVAEVEIPLVPLPDAGVLSAGSLPDPAPLVTRNQWVVDLAYRAGALSLGGVRAVSFAKPTATPRQMGRFAVELYVGRELIDRVRFDFPLLGADERSGGERRWDSPPSFERKVITRAAVIVPQSERATRAVLVDRATGRAWPLPWPFDPLAGAAAPRG